MFRGWMGVLAGLLWLPVGAENHEPVAGTVPQNPRPAVVCSGATGGGGGEQGWQSIVPGVWLLPGLLQDVGAHNQGRVAAQVLIRQGPGALLVDPGPSHAHGHAVRTAARCELGLEVTRVLNSHAHAENVLGNAAFTDVPIASTPAVRAAMAARCPYCLDAITRVVGDAAMAGTHIVWPEDRLASGQVIESDSGPWHLRVFHTAHSESDLALWNPRHRLLLAPGLVTGQRLPELAQGSLVGWLDALRELHRWAPQAVVGAQLSHHPGPDSGLRSTYRYLCDLADSVIQAMDEGQAASASAHRHLSAYAAWAGYAERHAFNVQRAWRELEPVWMEQTYTPCQPLD